MNQNHELAILLEHQETVEKTKPSTNFLIERCSYCNKDMELVENTVIHGEKWYHNSCWLLISRKDLERIIQIHEPEVCQT